MRGYRAEMLDDPALTLFRQRAVGGNQHGHVARRAAEWLRAGPVIVSYADIFYRGDLIRGLAGAPGALVITYDRRWRELWTRRFADPLSDAETFRIDGAGTLLEIGGKTTTSTTSRASTWDC